MLAPPLPANEERIALEFQHFRLAHPALLHHPLRRHVLVIHNRPHNDALIRRPVLHRSAPTRLQHSRDRLSRISLAPGCREEHVRNLQGEPRSGRSVARARWRRRFLGCEAAQDDEADEAGLRAAGSGIAGW